MEKRNIKWVDLNKKMENSIKCPTIALPQKQDNSFILTRYKDTDNKRN